MRAAFMYGAGDQLYLRSVNGPDASWYRFTRMFHQGRIEARGVARDVTWIDVNATEQPADNSIKGVTNAYENAR